jgi:hypothetical protein
MCPVCLHCDETFESWGIDSSLYCQACVHSVAESATQANIATCGENSRLRKLLGRVLDEALHPAYINSEIVLDIRAELAKGASK